VIVVFQSVAYCASQCYFRHNVGNINIPTCLIRFQACEPSSRGHRLTTGRQTSVPLHAIQSQRRGRSIALPTVYLVCSTHARPRRKKWGGGQRHAPAALPPGKRPDTNCIVDCVGRSRKFRPYRGSKPGRPTHSESLDRLCRPGHRRSMCMGQNELQVLT
jgi:hypothetical protein